jgi:hypothetical protein
VSKPGPRADGRKAAKDVSDRDVLLAVEGYGLGGWFPVDSLAARYPDIPRKVFVAKQRALEKRGLLQSWTLTGEGLRTLQEMEASE